MKRFLAFILAAIFLLSFPAYAGEARLSGVSGADGEEWVATDGSNLLGDVDGDGDVNIADVMYLQMYIAQLNPLSESGQRRADVDLNDLSEIIDVNLIQRWLAHIEGDYHVGSDVDKTRKALDDQEKKKEILDQINNFKRAKGVDISEFNGNVDMNKLKAAGYTFVIIRLGYGDDDKSQDDTMFETNVKKAEAAGLDWGAYIYSYALTTGQAKREVSHTLRLLKGKHPTMPIAFDWEDDSYKQRKGMPSNSQVLSIARTYLDGIYEAGYYPMIYTGYYWLKGAFNDSSIIDKYDIWLAQWSKTYDYHDRPIGMWQYGGEQNYIESVYISGLSGMFDKNYSYKNYPMIIKAYGYNNHEPLLESYASTGGYEYEDIAEEKELLPPECNGVMGDSLRGGMSITE